MKTVSKRMLDLKRALQVHEPRRVTTVTDSLSFTPRRCAVCGWISTKASDDAADLGLLETWLRDAVAYEYRDLDKDWRPDQDYEK